MKRSFVCALLTAALSCGTAAAYAQAQDSPPPPTQDSAPPQNQNSVPPSMVQEPGAGRQMPSSEQRLHHLSKALNLTSDQQEKIKPILASESQQMQQLRSDTSMSQQDRHGKMMQIRQTSRDQIKAVLTPDQQQKFEQMGPGGGMHRQAGGVPPPQ